MKTMKLKLGTFMLELVLLLIVIDYSYSQYPRPEEADVWPNFKTWRIHDHIWRYGMSQTDAPIGLLKNLSIPNIPGGMSISNEVDLYTGTNYVAIPLYSATARGLIIPLSVGYVASGIKVRQIAGPIGLGWSLNAGGCIRRLTRGIPDDLCGPGTYINLESGWLTDHESCVIETSNPSVSSEISSYSPVENERGCLKHLLGGLTSSCYTGSYSIAHDLEPDEFIIDCPYVHGSFVFSNERDNNNKPIISSIGQSNMKFEYTLGSYPSSDVITNFVITDETGNKFFFGGENLEKYMVYKFAVYVNNQQGDGSTILYLNGNFGYIGSFDRSYVNAWFLYKIETYLGEEVLFSYDKESFVADPSYSNYIRQETANPINPYKRYMSKFLMDPIFNSQPELADHIETYRIRKITGNDFVIDFLALNNRSDMINYITAVNANPLFPCKRIDKICIYKKFGANAIDTTLIRQFDFEYYNMHYDNCNPLNVSLRGCDLPQANNRLILKQITESSNYKSFMPYQFFYSPGILPNRFSYATDIYGFYNSANDNVTDVPNIYIYPTAFSLNNRFWCFELANYTTEFILPGANRQFNSTYAQSGLLNKIIYPSGTTVDFTYQPHIFTYKEQDNLDGIGFRLYLKTISENGINISTEQYLYENGKALGFPAYGYYDPRQNGNKDFNYWCDSYVRTGTNISNSEGVVGYDKVTIIRNQSGGYTEYNFENQPNLALFETTTPTIPTTGYYQPLGFEEDVAALIPQNGFPDDFNLYDLDIEDEDHDYILNTYPYPYRDHVNVEWFRGRVNLVLEKDENDQVVQRKEYTYQDRFQGSENYGDLNDQKIIYGIRTGFLENASHPPIAVATKYAIYTGVASLLSSLNTVTYTENGEISSQVVYTYNEAGQPLTTTQTNSDGTVFQQRSKWLYDYFNPREHPSYTNYYTTPTDPTANVLFNMAYQNLPNTLVEQTNELINGSGNYVSGAILNTYKEGATINSNVKYAKDAQYFIPTSSLIPTDQNTSGHFTYSGITSIQDPVFQFDSRYTPFNFYDKYDNNGRLIESHPANDIKAVLLWDDYQDIMVASAINADENECIYGGFEFKKFPLNSFVWSSVCIESDANQQAFAGNYYLKMNPTGFLEVPLDFSQNKPANNGYVASVWVKGDENITLSLSAMSNSTFLLTKSFHNYSPSTEWHLLSVSFTKSDIDQLNYDSFLIIVNNSSSSDALIDELKFYPSDAVLTSQSYDNKNNLISSSSKNELYAYAEYDDMGRTIMTRDFENNIITANSYNSSNPANFSICDCSSNQNDGIFVVGEPLTITCNSFGVSNFSFQFSTDNTTFSGCQGQASVTFSSTGLKTITMKAILNGIEEYTYSRNITIYK